MIILQIQDTESKASKTVTIPSALGASLKSTMLDHANELGERGKGSFDYDKEDSLTRATAAFNTLRSAINAVVPEEDPHYDW